MTITIEHISFTFIETTTKQSIKKELSPDKMEIHYLAFPTSEHEIRGMITMPFNEHIYLPEISRKIAIQITYNQK